MPDKNPQIANTQLGICEGKNLAATTVLRQPKEAT